MQRVQTPTASADDNKGPTHFCQPEFTGKAEPLGGIQGLGWIVNYQRLLEEISIGKKVDNF